MKTMTKTGRKNCQCCGKIQEAQTKQIDTRTKFMGAMREILKTIDVNIHVQV